MVLFGNRQIASFLRYFHPLVIVCLPQGTIQLLIYCIRYPGPAGYDFGPTSAGFKMQIMHRPFLTSQIRETKSLTEEQKGFKLVAFLRDHVHVVELLQGKLGSCL